MWMVYDSWAKYSRILALPNPPMVLLNSLPVSPSDRSLPVMVSVSIGSPLLPKVMMVLLSSVAVVCMLILVEPLASMQFCIASLMYAQVQLLYSLSSLRK